jgi:SAM-dependent methyltransferase
MHENNRRWLADLRRTYPEHFHRARVLELGSRVWGTTPHDSIRPYFTEGTYVGVDAIAGSGVDVVVEAQATRFEVDEFDTLAAFSLFEHDPDWRASLRHNLTWLRSGGLLVTCFGAEGNLPHLMDWCPVPHAEFLDYCAAETGIEVLDAFFEEERYGRDCAGCYNVVGKKKNP